jgi:hypothetical protein
MAKEKEKEEPKSESKGGKKKLHLHEIRSTQAHDGSIVHHHTYKDHKDSSFSQPERGPVATSADPEEAGQHVAEQFGMNQGAGAAPGGDPEPDPAAAAAPAGGPAQA